MGTKSKIEFSSGTLYFGDGCVVQNVEMISDDLILELHPIDYEILNKIRELRNVEITGKVYVKFRGLVLFMGFWPAVKWMILKWRLKLKNLWWALRTPINDEEAE